MTAAKDGCAKAAKQDVWQNVILLYAIVNKKRLFSNLVSLHS